MKRSRLALVPVSIVMSVGLLAGCGGGGGSSESSTSSSAAESSTTAAALKEGDTIAASEVASRMLTAMQKAGTMRMTTTVNGAETGVSEVVYDGDTASTRATVNSGGSMEIIALDNGREVYLKAPAMGVNDWTKVDAASDNPMIKAMATQLDSMKSMMDPAGAFKVYDQAGDFTVAGTETIDGVETTKFTGSLPMEAILDQLGPQGEAMKGQVGTEPVAIELYLDKEDRPIRLVQNMNVAGQSVSTVQNYSDFGADITVTAP